MAKYTEPEKEMSSQFFSPCLPSRIGKMFSMKFGDFLRSVRDRTDLSPTALSRKLGVSLAYITSIEKGFKRPPPIERCRQIADILSLSAPDRKKLLDLAMLERAPEELRPALEVSFKKQERSSGRMMLSETASHYRVPIVSRARASAERGHVDFEPVEHEFIEFKRCKAVEITSNSMAPLCYQGQKIIYSETDTPHDGDLVFVKLKAGDQLFKRYHKNHRKKLVNLASMNPVDWQEPLTVDEDEIEFCYKVVAVKF